MIYMNQAGDELTLPPFRAKCAVTGDYLSDMNRCPLCNFDDDGEICVPGLCDEYHEIETE